MKTMETQQALFPNWMRGFLLIACVYNMFWGIFIAWFPESFYHWVTESQNSTPEILIWQGRAVLVLGFVYFATDGIWIPFLIAIALKGKAYKANK